MSRSITLLGEPKSTQQIYKLATRPFPKMYLTAAGLALDVSVVLSFSEPRSRLFIHAGQLPPDDVRQRLLLRHDVCGRVENGAQFLQHDVE